MHTVVAVPGFVGRGVVDQQGLFNRVSRVRRDAGIDIFACQRDIAEVGPFDPRPGGLRIVGVEREPTRSDGLDIRWRCSEVEIDIFPRTEACDPPIKDRDCRADRCVEADFVRVVFVRPNPPDPRNNDKQISRCE